MELSELIGAVGAGVQEAQALVERTAEREYLRYFQPPAEGEGRALVPRTVKVTLPREDGTAAVLPVPLVALVNHAPLRLEQVRVRLNIAPTLTGRGTVEVTAAPAEKGGHSLELLFQAGEPGEGAARLNGAASQML